MRFLITAGNTRERIDQVRDWGNIFTGNTGLAIARAMAQMGDVDLLTSNQQHIADIQRGQTTPFAIHPSPFGTHAELRGALAALVTRTPYDAIFMSAAVSDYKPERTYVVVSREPAGGVADPALERWTVRDAQAGKVKGNHPAIAILGLPTEKIVDLFRKEWNYKGLLFKFKLEVGISKEELLRIGQESRKASGADYLIANTLDMVDGPDAGAFFLGDFGHLWVPRGNLPQKLAEIVHQRYTA